MEFIVTLRKNGGSNIVTIPHDIARAYDIKHDDQVMLDLVRVMKKPLTKKELKRRKKIIMPEIEREVEMAKEPVLVKDQNVDNPSVNIEKKKIDLKKELKKFNIKYKEPEEKSILKKLFKG